MAGVQVKKCTFAHKDKDRVFGAPHHQDPESARELVGIWKENMPDDARPTGPNIRAMNKLATMRWRLYGQSLSDACENGK